MNAPKGLLQILWERGFIDETNVKQYSEKEKKSQKDADGNVLPEYQKYILSNLMRECTDFKEEKTSMEKLMDKLSNLVAANKAALLTTPKCHCVLAAEGLELGWGL